MKRTYKGIDIEDVPITKEQLKVVPFLINDFVKMPVQTLEDGTYKAYCCECGTHIYNKEQYKKIRKTHECPNCKARYVSTTKYEGGYEFNNEIRIGNYGYRVWCNFDIDKGCEVTKYVQIARFDTDCVWARYSDMKFNMGSWTYSIEENLAKVQYHKSYSNYFKEAFVPYYSAYGYIKGLFKGLELKKCLEYNYGYITKSNQKKLIYDNRFDKYEIMAIKMFDLKTREEVEKHYDYIMKSKHDLEWRFDKYNLNVFYLDYLSRNNIDLGVYLNYYDLAIELGFKPDKPKDFEARYKKLQEIEEEEERRKEIERNKVYDEEIAKRYEKLPKYQSENITISPFKSSQEIIECGKTLHDCIGSYVERYAENSTDIYHLDIDGAITIALEIRDNELWQAYADHNSKCSKNLMKHIKAFCKQHKYKLGDYAH